MSRSDDTSDSSHKHIISTYLEKSNNVSVIKYPQEAIIFGSVCAILFCIIGVIGNLVTIVALIRCPKLRCHATTAFVLSLCVSDLLFCSVNLPLTASRYINQAWTLGDALCKLFPVLFYGNVAVSLLNMVAITLNRYVLISYTHCYNQLYSARSIWVQLIFCWAFAFLLMLAPLLEIWGQLGLSPSTFSCTILKKNGRSPKKYFFLFGFVLPCVVIISSYSCIYFKVRESRKRLKAYNQGGAMNERAHQREGDDHRLTKLMLLIFLCFLMCFLPLMCVNVFDDDVRYPAAHVLASILAWASSVINPFIYAFSNRQYRTAYTKLLDVFKSNIILSETRPSNNGSCQPAALPT